VMVCDLPFSLSGVFAAVGFLVRERGGTVEAAKVIIMMMYDEK
jgi:hypothetical protein